MTPSSRWSGQCSQCTSEHVLSKTPKSFPNPHPLSLWLIFQIQFLQPTVSSPSASSVSFPEQMWVLLASWPGGHSIAPLAPYSATALCPAPSSSPRHGALSRAICLEWQDMALFHLPTQAIASSSAFPDASRWYKTFFLRTPQACSVCVCGPCAPWACLRPQVAHPGGWGLRRDVRTQGRGVSLGRGRAASVAGAFGGHSWTLEQGQAPVLRPHPVPGF